jgi:hypothetical protein
MAASACAAEVVLPDSMAARVACRSRSGSMVGGGYAEVVERRGQDEKFRPLRFRPLRVGVPHSAFSMSSSCRPVKWSPHATIRGFFENDTPLAAEQSHGAKKSKK